MTRDSAIQQMKKGNKVQHRYFRKHEYLHLVNAKIVTEDGCDFTDQLMAKDFFHNGWHLFTPNTSSNE